MRKVMVSCCVLIGTFLWGAAPIFAQAVRKHIPVFVAAKTEYGFVSGTSIMDSVKDLQKQLGRKKEFVLVDTPEQAVIIVTVGGRGIGAESYGQQTTTHYGYYSSWSTAAPMVANRWWLEAGWEVVKGDGTVVNYSFTGDEAYDANDNFGRLGVWGRLAAQIANSLQSWTRANWSQLITMKTAGESIKATTRPPAGESIKAMTTPVAPAGPALVAARSALEHSTEESIANDLKAYAFELNKTFTKTGGQVDAIDIIGDALNGKTVVKLHRIVLSPDATDANSIASIRRQLPQGACTTSVFTHAIKDLGVTVVYEYANVKGDKLFEIQVTADTCKSLVKY